MSSLMNFPSERMTKKGKQQGSKKKKKTTLRKSKVQKSVRMIDQMETTQGSDRKKKNKKSASAMGMTSTRTKKPVALKSSRAKEETSEMTSMSSKTHMEPPIAATPSTHTPTATSKEKSERKDKDKDKEKEKSGSEKWIGKDAAKSFIDRIDTMVARTEFIEIQTIIGDPQKCSIWQKNKAKNQTELFPCFDQNLVKSAQNADDYVNATSVQVPHVIKPILIGQIPKKETFEEFWKIIFEMNVMLMHVLIAPDEVADFFPHSAGAYEHFGSMFVNNRKVEKMDAESSRLTMEVLPTGCSNSNLITIVLHNDWLEQNVPAKFGKTVKSVIDVTNFVQSSPADEKCLIISKFGAGRAGFFLSLCSAVSSLNNKNEPRLLEIVKTIREQRPGAVESFKQYTSLYLCLVYYIKKKLNDPKMHQKTALINEAFKSLLEGAGQSVMQ